MEPCFLLLEHDIGNPNLSTWVCSLLWCYSLSLGGSDFSPKLPYFHFSNVLCLIFCVLFSIPFSKLYSIAACRLGVIIGSPDIIRYAKKAKLTFDVNSIALLFGERLLDHPEIREQLIQKEKAGKKYILEKLHENGYNCKDCRGNFIFVQPKKNPKEIEKYLREEKHILVKSFSNELLKTYLRISTGSVKAMDAFLQAFLQADR